MTEEQGNQLITQVQALTDLVDHRTSLTERQGQNAWLVLIGFCLLTLVFLQAARFWRSL